MLIYGTVIVDVEVEYYNVTGIDLLYCNNDSHTEKTELLK